MDVYVAPNGKDVNPGTKTQPFGTLEAARDAIRSLKKNESVTVLAIRWAIRANTWF